MVWIAGQNLTSNQSGVINFTSIPQTFTHLQVRAFIRSTNSGNETVYARLNGDGSALYAQHSIFGDGASAGSSAASGTTFTDIAPMADASKTANVFTSLVWDLLDYTNTNKFKTYRTISGVDYNGSGSTWLASGLYRSTSPITTVTIGGAATVGLAAGSAIHLYGITTSQVTGA